MKVRDVLGRLICRQRHETPFDHSAVGRPPMGGQESPSQGLPNPMSMPRQNQSGEIRRRNQFRSIFKEATCAGEGTTEAPIRWPLVSGRKTAVRIDESANRIHVTPSRLDQVKDTVDCAAEAAAHRPTQDTPLLKRAAAAAADTVHLAGAAIDAQAGLVDVAPITTVARSTALAVMAAKNAIDQAELGMPHEAQEACDEAVKWAERANNKALKAVTNAHAAETKAGALRAAAEAATSTARDVDKVAEAAKSIDQAELGRPHEAQEVSKEAVKWAKRANNEARKAVANVAVAETKARALRAAAQAATTTARDANKVAEAAKSAAASAASAHLIERLDL